MSDNIVFVLSGYLEEDLFALPVMMHYLATRVVVGRHPDSVTLVCKNMELAKVADAFWKDIIVVAEPSADILDKADFVFEFDTLKAYELTESVKKHIAEAYGIQLGVGLTRILPPLLVEDIPEIPGTVLVVERNDKDRPLKGSRWEHGGEFIKIAKENKIPFEYLYSVASFEQTRQAIGRASVIVGPRSTATLVGASSGKMTFELSPEEQHPYWMGKFENGKYKMVYGKIEEVTGEMAWAGLLEMLGKIKQQRKAA